MKPTPHLFCFGLGYSALSLAKRLLEKGWRVSGTCRTAEKCESLTPLGITAHLFDTDLPLLHPEGLVGVTHILTSIPPSENGDPVLLNHKNDLSALKDLEWVGYLSTTGVYGDHKGEWVDEKTPVNPPNERSIRRAKAETDWLDTGLPAHIFRLSGIYGAGRDSFTALKEGTAKRIDKPNHLFSRIHVEDIANILEASIASPNPSSIYNCADDLPAAQSDIVAYAAELMGVAAPDLVPFEEADLSPMAKSFWQNNRRVSNKKIKEELGVTLSYPSYKEGLEAIKSDL